MDALLISFGLIFLAELGDKSQLMAMTFAARYKASTILFAITAATAVVHLASVLLGAVLGVALPTRAISIVAGAAFLAFAAWTLRGDELDDAEAARAARLERSVFFSVAGAFFLAELGDKTMLTSAGLAADRGAVPVWIGSAAAMLSATALAVIGGRALAARVQPALLRRIGAVAFAVVGIVTLAGAAAS